MTMTPIEQADEQRPVGREGAGRSRGLLLRRKRAGERQHRDDIGEAAEQHREAERRVEPERIAGESRERRAVVGVGGGEGVDDLGQPVRPALFRLSSAGLEQHGGADEAEHDQRIDQHRQHRELHLARLDLLAEIFRRAADHQTRDEHSDDRENEKAVEPRADAARPDAAGRD